MMNIQEMDEQELCRQIFNMLGTCVKFAASYECKGRPTVGCGSDLVDVFVHCEVFGSMNIDKLL